MFSRFSIVLSSALALASLRPSANLVWAHAYPAAVSPGDGTTITEAPQEVRIRFTEGIELEFSRIDVKSANGEKVAQGKLRKVADDVLAIDLKPLGSGSYIIEWQVLSVDTHVTDGVLRFTLRLTGK
jgi:methionine-rich copper-binding protein CopC